MDQREYFEDSEEALRSSWAGIEKRLFTSLVCIVAEDSDGHTLKAQPAIKRRDVDQYGNETFVDFPLLVDVPIHFPGGGGATFTHPVKKGDEVLVHFTSRPHDSWFQSGGTQQPTDTRMHSLSDGMATVGFRSTPRKFDPPVDTTQAQMRSDDGKHTMSLHPTDGISLKSSTKVKMEAPSLEHVGSLTLSPDANGVGGNLTINSVSPTTGNLIVGQNLTVAKTIVADTVSAPNGSVG